MTDAPLSGRARGDRGHVDLATWRAGGGYAAVEATLTRHGPSEIVEMVDAANLRGRGGAGFPSGQKWGFMPDPGGGQSYLCVNGDEMEPCTFKDRFLMEALAHQLLEGVIIAAYAMGATEAYVLIRDAYRTAAAHMARAIEEARAAGFLGRDILGTGFDLDVHIHMSAGRYIVGEESALLNAIEGHRPVPRARPPYPAQSGLWGRPTTVNNVETLSNVPHIVAEGPEAFRARSRTDEGGTKLFGVSGRVRRPCLVERPMGTTARELIEAAGCVAGSGTLLAFQPGGGSSEFMGPEHLDVPLDYTHCQEAGSWFGTGMLIVMDDTACPLSVIARHLTFYARESCGWCTPCREGLPWLVEIMGRFEDGTATAGDLDILHMHVDRAGPSGRAFCGLMGGATDMLGSGLARFADRFEARVAPEARRA